MANAITNKDKIKPQNIIKKILSNIAPLNNFPDDIMVNCLAYCMQIALILRKL